MPRRRRDSKRRDALTPKRLILLTVGPLVGPGDDNPPPLPGTDEWDDLLACWHANRDDFAADTDVTTWWACRVFDAGQDPYDASIKIETVD
jgi:hypothetical protein